VLGDQAADERADREGERGHAGPDADRRSPLLRRNVTVMIESVAGFISAAPSPWTTRAAIRIVASPARPHASGREREDGEADDEHQAPAGEIVARACRP
jgi:hypothetical protein